MTDLQTIADELQAQLPAPLSLVVASRGEGTDLDASKVKITTDAGTAFRELCAAAIEILRGRNAVEYSSDAELTSDDAFVLTDPALLAELSTFVSLGANAATLPVKAPTDLTARLQMYAVVLGGGAATLVRRMNPRMPHTSGKVIMLAKEQLTRLEDPIFSFSAGFDLIVSETWAVVMNGQAFEHLYRDLGLIEAHVKTWVTGITDHLPMSDEGVTALTQVAARDSRTWRKLQEIKRRGHLQHVTITDIENYAAALNYDPTRIVRDGQLVFDTLDANERFTFLHLLNEDLYQGYLSHETFEAQRKASAD